MNVTTFTNFESEVLSSFNKGNNTFEKLVENLPIPEKTLGSIIEGLISKNILNLNTKLRAYEYQTKVSGETVILDGNILLPTTVIKIDDKLLVSRGDWYEFPLDFDIRRIIWNVKLTSKTNSTLVEMINSSVLKEKKSKIVHLSEHDNIKNRIVPYNQNFGLYLNSVGEELTDVSILFKTKIAPETEVITEHKGFKVSGTISTKELIDQVYIPVDERDYEKNIKLNKIYNFSDFIFSKNEIPINVENGVLTYVKISGVRKVFELSFYEMKITGTASKIDVETFSSMQEGIERIKELFSFAHKILEKNGFLVEFE